jgi:hypothetical protein
LAFCWHPAQVSDIKVGEASSSCYAVVSAALPRVARVLLPSAGFAKLLTPGEDEVTLRVRQPTHYILHIPSKQALKSGVQNRDEVLAFAPRRFHLSRNKKPVALMTTGLSRCVTRCFPETSMEHGFG